MPPFEGLRPEPAEAASPGWGGGLAWRGGHGPGIGRVDVIDYTYNRVGQLTSISNTQDGAARDLQCFTTDYLGRLTQAWTDTGTTTTAPQPSVRGIGGCSNSTGPAIDGAGKPSVGGPAPYWQQYEYDKIGNRTKLVKKLQELRGGRVPQVVEADAAELRPVEKAAEATGEVGGVEWAIGWGGEGEVPGGPRAGAVGRTAVSRVVLVPVAVSGSLGRGPVISQRTTEWTSSNVGAGGVGAWGECLVRLGLPRYWFRRSGRDTRGY
ncbi:hypothetical protein ACFVFI_17360 [Streptomyces sp. NPDC057705]|uniref:hypothetical protein n=1 Tax=Streptomyces sp. NPDC057705 TaxID=3346222 RepID=UPI0036BDA406